MFYIKTLLGLNFLVLLLFTCLMASIIAIGYAGEVVTIAGAAIPIYIAGSLLFTTTYIFNPPDWCFAIYAKNGEPQVTSYATEPWVDRYDPYVWKHALFYTDNFSLNANKYVEFNKEDALVGFTIKFRLNPSLAKVNFARLDKNSRDHDIAIAIGVIRELITESVKELLASEEFTYTMDSLNKTLVHLPINQQHQTKREVFRGALQNLIQSRVHSEQVKTLLYSPVFESAKITVGNAIYYRPSN